MQIFQSPADYARQLRDAGLDAYSSSDNEFIVSGLRGMKAPTPYILDVLNELEEIQHAEGEG